MLNAACGCVVVMLPGWRELRGVAHEIAEFQQQGKPVVFLSETIQKLYNKPHLLVSMSHCTSYASAVAVWD